MRRVLIAIALGAFVTLLPYALRPVVGEQAAIFWLPGFAAISHWFPLGLRGPDGSTAKVIACLVNVPIWAAAFILFSALVHLGTRPGTEDAQSRNREQPHRS